MPNPFAYPPTPVVFVEAITTGIVASAGSTAKFSVQVYDYYRTSTVPTFSKSAFDTAFQAAVVVPLYAALNARLTQSNNSIRVLNDAFNAPQFFNHAVVGSITGDSMPLSNSVFIEGRTGIRGKRARGSKKLFPVSESQTTTGTDDILNAGALTVYGTFAAAWLAGFSDANGNNWVPVIVSRKYSQLKTNNVSIWWNQMTEAVLRKTIGSMRKRKVVSVY